MSDLKLPTVNSVILAGRLTRDAEGRTIPSGQHVAQLGLAVSRKYKAKDGSEKEERMFINVTAWAKLAQWAETLKKGRPVMVEGKLTMDEWDDKSTGQKRTAIGITAHSIQTLDWEDRGETSRRGVDPHEQQGDAALPEDEIPF